jgi:hypothetical protein
MKNGRVVDGIVVVALGSWLACVASSCTARASVGEDINAGITGKFVIANAIGFIEEALVFAGATVAMCITMAATTNACTEGWLFFVFDVDAQINFKSLTLLMPLGL